jgi:hypothetical protein
MSGGEYVVCTSEALGEGFGFALEQVVALLGALELALHLAQRLPRGEDGFSVLSIAFILDTVSMR